MLLDVVGHCERLAVLQILSTHVCIKLQLPCRPSAQWAIQIGVQAIDSCDASKVISLLFPDMQSLSDIADSCGIIDCRIASSSLAAGCCLLGTRPRQI